MTASLLSFTDAPPAPAACSAEALAMVPDAPGVGTSEAAEVAIVGEIAGGIAA